jgi:acyl phosphate:glycerol-3-phosphate acyltransferase
MLSAVPLFVTIVTVIVGYLVGSVPIANLVAGRRAGTDLREVGDRNPGYWNAKETLGRRSAVPVFVGDVAKGALAAALGLVLAAEGQWWLAYVGAAAAMVGHAFPVFAGFRGGRSVLTFVGGALVFTPIAAAISVAILVLTFGGTRNFAVASRTGMVALPFVQLVVDGPYRTAATGALMTFIGLRFAQAALQGSRTRDRATSGGAG